MANFLVKFLFQCYKLCVHVVLIYCLELGSLEAEITTEGMLVRRSLYGSESSRLGVVEDE